MRRPVIFVGVYLAVSITAGCSSSSSDDLTIETQIDAVMDSGPVSSVNGAETTTGSTSPPADTYATAMVACMAEKGWTVEPDGDDGIAAVYPPDQFEVAFQDQQNCVDETGFGVDPPALTSEQFQVLYDGRIEQQKCLVAAGYDATDPPSLDVFVESSGAWSPFRADITADDLNAQREVCPDPVP